MPKTDPFAKDSYDKTLLGIVKNLEIRWGLTLVSFLPPNAQERIVKLQYSIAKLWRDKQTKDVMRRGRLYVKFYAPQHFHCTHLTLTRSDPSGPIQEATFVKEGYNLLELFEKIHEVTSKINPIRIELNRMRVTTDGLGITLLGECLGEDSIQSRARLLKELNKTIPISFNTSSRSWDTNSSHFYKLHCALGYLKRPVPQTYQVFVTDIKNIEFEPITFTLENIELVHHRHRSLAFPQEGIVVFPLGEKVNISANKFVDSINLA